MYQNRPRRFRRHSNGSNHQLRDNGGTQVHFQTVKQEIILGHHKVRKNYSKSTIL